MSIAGRAIASLIHTQGIGDLYRIYATAAARRRRFQPDVHPVELQLSAQGRVRQRVHAQAVRRGLRPGRKRHSLGQDAARVHRANPSGNSPAPGVPGERWNRRTLNGTTASREIPQTGLVRWTGQGGGGTLFPSSFTSLGRGHGQGASEGAAFGTQHRHGGRRPVDRPRHSRAGGAQPRRARGGGRASRARSTRWSGPRATSATWCWSIT